MPSDDTLKGITNYNNATPTLQIENGLVAFFDWGLLNIGAFFNVNRPQSGIYGGDFSRLRLHNDNNFTLGRVWQGVRTNWVYESGLYCDNQPINISGVYVNNIFYPSDTIGTYKHIIDYPNGRVIFDNAISTNANVQLNYSYKTVNVMAAPDSPWYQELMFNSYRPDLFAYTNLVSSGNWSIVGNNRVQLPLIIVDCVPGRSFTGYELGGGQNMYQKVCFRVFAESKNVRDMLCDIISDQNDKTVMLFDLNSIATNNDFPLNYNGTKSSTCKTFKQLIDSYPWKRVTFEDTAYTLGQEFGSNLYMGEITTRAWVIRSEI